MVSIVIGIYNVASFLQHNKLKCIFNQTYSDWELILVDDGSTDESGEICDEFARKDNRIKVIHKENGGLGSARNAGLEVAKGDYVWFYDVDDDAHLNLLEYCVGEMEQRNLEMLQFGFKVITPSQNIEDNVQLHKGLIEGQDQLRSCFLDIILFVKYGNGFMWNKFYRYSFIEKNHLRFDNLRIQQDEVFNLKAYQQIQRIYLSSEILYDYYIYEKGNTRSWFIPNRFDIYVSIRDQFEQLRNAWTIIDSRYDNYLNERFYQNIDETIRYNLLHSDCPWKVNEKKQEMGRVLNHPYAKEAMAWAKQNMQDLECRLYYQAYKQRNYYLLSVYASFFSVLRQLKHFFCKR